MIRDLIRRWLFPPLKELNIVLDPIVRDSAGRDLGTPSMPERAHEWDAGLDLYSPYFQQILPRGSATIDTGVHVEIPPGYSGTITSRSSMSIKYGVVAGQGTIDAGYTGSIRVILFNMTDESYQVHTRHKIAQLVIHRIETPVPVQVYELPETERGDNGIGSTGR